MAQTTATLYVDFGTAYVKCAVKLPDGSFKLLLIKGHPAVPAYLCNAASNGDGDFYIGHDAKELSITDTHSVWFYPILFFRHNSPYTTYWINKLRLPFSVTHDARTMAHAVNFGSTSVSVVELLGIFLKELRQICQDEVGSEYMIADCVIASQSMNLIQSGLSLSASSSGFQRVALIERQQSQMAGLLHYFPEWRNAHKHIIVIRVGACFTSLSIHVPEKNKRTYGIVEFFGGNDIDELLADHCLQHFEELYGLTSISPQPVYSKESVHRLRLNCEAVKIQLSTARSVKLEVRQFHAGCDLVVELTVDKFKDIIGNACYTTLRKVIDSALGHFASLRSNVEYEVVLLGGTSKVPVVQEMVGWMLRKPNQRVRNVMDAVLLTGMGLSPVEKYESCSTENMAGSNRISQSRRVRGWRCFPC